VQAFDTQARVNAKAQEDLKSAGDLTMWELTQSGRTASKATHKDHRNNESRVRKLFGIAMCPTLRLRTF